MDLQIYESAVAKHYATSKVLSFPLHSFDFYASFLVKLKMSLTDTVSLTALANKNAWNTKWDFKEKLLDEMIVVVTDAKLQIVFASKNIVSMNGYEASEVVGKSPKMFQGELTDKKTSEDIGIAVRNRLPFEKVIVNYCKDGTVYNCHIKGYPVFNKKGVLTNYIALERIAA